MTRKRNEGPGSFASIRVTIMVPAILMTARVRINTVLALNCLISYPPITKNTASAPNITIVFSLKSPGKCFTYRLIM